MMMTGLAGTPMAMGDRRSSRPPASRSCSSVCATRRWAPTSSPSSAATWRPKKIIVVKSSQHFYASFSKVAKHVIYVGAPGAVTLDLNTLPYRKIRRPKWPLRA